MLREVPAKVRFLSIEPMLGPVDRVSLNGISWVIVGGESGPHYRPMDVEWVREVRDRCAAALEAAIHTRPDTPPLVIGSHQLLDDILPIAIVIQVNRFIPVQWK